MKTIADLNALIPTLVEQLRHNDHEIGTPVYEADSDGGYNCYYEGCENSLIYEEDGWSIEILYNCYGEWDYSRGDNLTPDSSDLERAKGEITDLSVSYYDEDTDEEVEFTDKNLNELWKALDKELENIA